jgi:hypothetical protein
VEALRNPTMIPGKCKFIHNKYFGAIAQFQARNRIAYLLVSQNPKPDKVLGYIAKYTSRDASNIYHGFPPNLQ